MNGAHARASRASDRKNESAIMHQYYIAQKEQFFTMKRCAVKETSVTITFTGGASEAAPGFGTDLTSAG